MGVFEASQQIRLGEEDLKDEDDICGFLDRHLPERLDPKRPLRKMYFFPRYRQA
jgi:hypothetical protein